MQDKIRRRTIGGIVLATISAVIAAGAVYATATWSYSGQTGPEYWASLDPSYALCADGSAQSPINITKTTKKKLKNIKFNYSTNTAEVFNNGHTVEAEPLDESNTITLSGVEYAFLQFHFHADSEHEIAGKSYPLEIHFVHKAEDGTLAVVGIMVKKGKKNEAWQSFVDVIGSATANAADTEIDINWNKLLPKKRTTYRYAGSLTTPGCAEGVNWNVLTEPIQMSKAQIKAFTDAYADNNRPVQPRNNREIKLDISPNK